MQGKGTAGAGCGGCGGATPTQRRSRLIVSRELANTPWKGGRPGAEEGGGGGPHRPTRLGRVGTPQSGAENEARREGGGEAPRPAGRVRGEAGGRKGGKRAVGGQVL